MILCDVGNTYFHFYQNGKIWKENLKNLSSKKEKVFYISVNPEFESALLKHHHSCINLAPFFALDTGYVGLGIDRIAACEVIEEGVVVDAGSAITIDVMQGGMHLGGYILPGIGSFVDMYAKISPALKVMPDLSVGFDLLPQNTREALGYGILKSIVGVIDDASKGKKIYFCGGDGKFLARFFDQSIYDDTLVFQGMQKALERYMQKLGSAE
ncbi:type III pantothenate kinase [Helicobacter pametensis]|uniref:type III pantothenate kinase n=1 Tax=Helicobacter pametensis TaxID=95149 RepID=UPI0004874D3F|nr:type III pantothenate kinase [Helicobacter pametensis]